MRVKEAAIYNVTTQRCCLFFQISKYYIHTVKSKQILACQFNIPTIFVFVCVCLTQAGIYWVTLIDQFAASWVVLILVLLEIIGFCYIYGD